MQSTPRKAGLPGGPITLDQARVLSKSVPGISAKVPTDAMLQAQVDGDSDVAPLATADELAAATLVTGPTRTLISLRVDNDVLDAYKATGKGWQTRMHEVLAASVRSTAGDTLASIELHLEQARLAIKQLARR